MNFTSLDALACLAAGCMIAQSVSIRTSFLRPDAPLLMETADLGRPNCFATRAINSSFALPSTGGDLTCAIQLPSAWRWSDDARALGFTLTSIIVVGISGARSGRWDEKPQNTGPRGGAMQRMRRRRGRRNARPGAGNTTPTPSGGRESGDVDDCNPRATGRGPTLPPPYGRERPVPGR